MQLPVIKTYRPQITLSDHHFFILSKGNNAGKPLDQPCPNCFVAFCSSPDDREFFYWLSYALWQAGIFRIQLIGSVIPFIRINDLKHCLCKGSQNALHNITLFNSSIAAIRKHHDTYTRLVTLMNQKQSLLQKRLRYLLAQN
jgi:hypothetical protein